MKSRELQGLEAKKTAIWSYVEFDLKEKNRYLQFPDPFL